jgi:HSP20 family protein
MANTRTNDSTATERSSAAAQQPSQHGAQSQSSSLQGSQQAGGPLSDQQSGGQGGVQSARGAGTARYSRDPFTMVHQLADEMDQLFDSFFYGGTPSRRSGRQSAAPTLWAPEVELAQEGNQLRLCVDLPGVSKENVNVQFEEGALIIQGERRDERRQGGEQQGYRRTELRYGSFYRAIPLPEGVNVEQAQAQMKDGVLEITIPLAPEKQPRKLDIK